MIEAVCYPDESRRTSGKVLVVIMDDTHYAPGIKNASVVLK